MDLFNSTKIYNKLYLLLIILITIIFFAYHIHIITFPYQLEFREGASIQTTNALLNGKNPYAIENQPQNTNVYGILYSIACYPFAKIVGSSLHLHRAVSGIFILLSCLIVYLLARLGKHPILPSFTVCVILYASLLYFVTPLVRPDSLGLFLFLLSLYIPFRYNYSSGSLLVSSFIGVFAFFTKTFFLLNYPFLGSYLFLFVSKKKGITFSIFSCFILIISALAVNSFCETYVANVFFNNMNVGTYNFKHLIRQLYFGVKSYAFIFIIFVFATLSIVLKKGKQIKAYFIDNNLLGSLLNFMDVRNLNFPLFMFNFKCTSYYLLCSVVVFCVLIGGHGAAWMTYFYQLISPFFFLMLLDFSSHAQIPKSYLYLMLAGIINLSLFYITVLPHYSVEQIEHQWETICELINRNNNIFNSPAIASVLQKQNKEVYDSGQSALFRFSFVPNKFSFLSINYNNKASTRLKCYRREVEEAVKSQKYDIIIITKWNPLIDTSLLPKYYDKKNTLSAPMPHCFQNHKLELWTKKVDA